MLFVTGLGAVVPLPGMGALAVASAALRTYALTVNAALAGTGVYTGALIIGGLVERGDIHRHEVAAVGRAGTEELPTLDPDTITDTARGLSARRNLSEATFNALGRRRSPRHARQRVDQHLGHAHRGTGNGTGGGRSPWDWLVCIDSLSCGMDQRGVMRRDAITIGMGMVLD